ncbi:MAG: diadenylate cyclase CdaA [Erysipelotrichaceae bacterium]|nr:diadenylate cyclase CdaA [Erysipelotrichaceae bacterium]MDD3924822.1 diadenylate cyclase CdaA [Erysipelotrichaceae bacterium]MDD4642354.1 diadenylate cyclase CdaA [Erysipelotrichaceae bacterium]
MLSYTTLQNMIQIARMVIDIAIITLLVYYCLKIVRNNSRTIQIFKGVLFVVFMNAVAQFFGLKTVKVVADILVQWGFLAVIIIFQPEIRSILEKLGKSSVFSRMSSLSGNEREELVDEIVDASMNLASQRVGALITIEQTHSLSDYIKTGTPMNSIVTADLLSSIFVTTTPLHDGAVIIQGDRIACASAYFLPTDKSLPRRYGARHRAAVGISEITDSITIVVSEQTGSVSLAKDGELTKMTQTTLRKFLLKAICNEEVEHGDNNDQNEDKNERIESIFNDLIEKEDEPIVIEKIDEDVDDQVNDSGVLKIFRKSKTDQEEINGDQVVTKPKKRTKKKDQEEVVDTSEKGGDKQ